MLRSNKWIERIGIVFILVVGVVPLTWFQQNAIIAKGDSFPFWLRPDKTLRADSYLWSSNYLGGPNTFGSYLIYELVWLFFRSMGLSVGLTQILFQVFFFAGSGLFMHKLARTVYPKLTFAPVVSGIFYMFNFFVLEVNVSNIGLSWTYTFMPLLLFLLVRTIKSLNQDAPRTLNRNILYFAVVSSITFSFASQNPANIVLILLVLGIIFSYYVVLERKVGHKLLTGTVKLTLITLLLNLWWIIPLVNYYIWSPLHLQEQIHVTTWSWTHARASFLNLFWLNGFWGWRPEYFPFYDFYLNPILIVLTFIPFLLAATALLFKTNKSRFNAYMMLTILAFLFFAKGLHEPLSQLNLLLYTYIPGMNVFREPASKFTMVLLPFLALLIGYAVHHIASTRIANYKPTNITKTLVATFFILTLIVSSYPLITNPIETKTLQLPFSTYIKIPDYWYEATDWLDNQPSNYKTLITPADDFYQMPYIWGYYGTEFLTRLIQKPILANYYSYKTNPEITLTLQQLYNSIKYNRTVEFKAFLDLLNVKYILQRNDIQYNFTGRNIIPSNKMQAFLTHQPYIHLEQKFGQLDIYEYDEPKPYIYTLRLATLKETAVKIENITLQRSWNFTSITDVQEWQNATQPNQWQINYTITQDNNTLRAELWNSTFGWKTINSPLLPAQYGDTYQVQADLKGQNAYQVHIKMVEYDTNKKILAATYLTGVNDGTFNWFNSTFEFEPTNKSTNYLQIQVWHGHETDKPFPNIIWLDNVKIHGYTIRLNATDINLIFQNTAQNQPATALNYTKVNPTKITATINATQPFILAISEALDQSWKAYVNGKQIENIPLYLGLKGFQINQTGLFEVTIEYEPQKWFYYSAIISGITFLACLTYLTYNYTKSKNIWKQIKTISYWRRITAKQSN